MARPRLEHPRAHLRRRGKIWRIFWRGRGRQWEVSLGAIPDGMARNLRDLADLALRRVQDWPPELMRLATVHRWLAADNRIAGQVGDDDTALLERYEGHLAASVSDRWRICSMAALRELAGWMRDNERGGLLDVSQADAVDFIDHIPGSPGPFGRSKSRAPAQRNRILAICRRFFRWAVGQRLVVANPFSGIKLLREEHPEQILHCSRRERYVILRAARGLRRDERLLVWIALYAGLRRGEIARLAWEDIDLERGRLVVRRSKTGRRRVVPIAGRLRRRLARARPGRLRRHHPIVPWPEAEAAWAWRARELTDRLRGLVLELDPDLDPALVAWTPWRHTFGSLLAQAGVSIDKISAWMGNTPEVCRRHYAEFIPRGMRDEEIDRL